MSKNLLKKEHKNSSSLKHSQSEKEETKKKNAFSFFLSR